MCSRSARLQAQRDLDLAQVQRPRDARVRDVQHVAAEVADQRRAARPARPGGRRSASAATGSGRPTARPCWITCSSTSGSMLPPESTATTGGANRRGCSISAATAAAPAGSTTSFARSRQCSSARDSASSSTVTIVVDQRGDLRERHVARPPDRDAVGEGAHRRAARTGAPRGQRRRPRGRLLGLHPDDPHVRSQAFTRRRDAAEQAAAAGRGPAPSRTSGHLLEDLQPDGALPGDDVDVVERVHEHRAGRARRTRAPRRGLVDRVRRRGRTRRRSPGRGDLGQRRAAPA